MTFRLPTLTIGRHHPRLPLVQGGMGVMISGPRLAGATAAAGAVGTLASVGLWATMGEGSGNQTERNSRAIIKALAQMREAAPHGVLAVNCMVALKDYPEHVKAACRGGTDVIISGAGLPLSLPALTADFPNVALVPIVSSLRALQLIIKRWTRDYDRLPDAVVVETPNHAGGHLGARDQEQAMADALSLAAVLPQIVEWQAVQGLDIPLLPAGGIWTADDIRHFIEMGAAGVQVGSRFVVTEECDASDRFKQAFLDATPDDVVLVDSPAGLPGRAVRSPLLERGLVRVDRRRCTADCLGHCRYRDKGECFCLAEALIAAWHGDWERGLFFCGSQIGRAHRIETVQTVLDDLLPRAWRSEETTVVTPAPTATICGVA